VLHEAVRSVHRRGGEVFLNPQPLPPRELLRLETLAAARAVAGAVIAAQFAGRGAREVLQEVGDDWCPTRPGVIPWPKHWPHPVAGGRSTGCGSTCRAGSFGPIGASELFRVSASPVVG